MQIPSLLPALLVLPLIACGADSGASSSASRGGPDSLVGFKWTSEPVTAGGIEFVLALSFAENSVTAANTCNGELTASTSTPVRYRYTATIPKGDSVENTKDGSSCFASIDAGSFDFEIVDGNLVANYQGETLTFEPVGAVNGLYGRWQATGNGLTLSWSMGNGEILVDADCHNGVTASVRVDADFENRIEFVEAAEQTESDDFGFDCSVSIARGMATYYFDGDALVLSQEGQAVRFEPK